MNPRKKHRRKHNARSRRRGLFNPRRRRYYARNPHHRHFRHRRHNPALTTRLLTTAVWGSVGAVGTRALTQMILQSSNQSWMGYGGNVAVAYGLALVAEKAVGADAGDAVLLGGLIATVLRVAKEQLFASSPLASELALQGLGDPDFALRGYVNDPFLLPTTSEGQDMLTRFPQIAAWTPAPAPPVKGRSALAGYYSGSAATVGPGAIVDRYNPTWG